MRHSDGPTTTPTVTSSLDPAAMTALQQLLAGEHAVVWAYGALGPRLDEAGEELARSLLVAHQRNREAVRAQVIGAGGQPVVAEPAYALPITPTDPNAAARLAGLVEERLAAVYADLVASATDVDLRWQGVAGVVQSAVRAALWGLTGTTFPGLRSRPYAQPSRL